MDILDRVLQKLGKRSREELSDAAKITYDQYRQFLVQAEKGITLPMLYDFKKAEKERILMELANPNIKLNSEIDMFLKAELRICLTDIAMLDSPQKGIEMLERQLIQKFNLK